MNTKPQASSQQPQQLTKEEMEAAQRGFLHEWKEEQSIHHLLTALSNMRMTPHMWTAGNILFMLSFYFRYREGDPHTIWVLTKNGKHEAKDSQWFEGAASQLNCFTFSGLRITTLWFMFAYTFFEKKNHLLSPLHNEHQRSSKESLWQHGTHHQ
jgi:hypothetical protein